VTRYSRHVLPGGMVVTLMMPPMDYTYSTPLYLPASFIPFTDPAERRREAAATVLAVLREASLPVTRPTLAGKPCAACAFRPKARPELPHFPLPPFEPYEPYVPPEDRLPYRIEFCAPWQTSAAIRLSSLA
jgi:hypothetical protein